MNSADFHTVFTHFDEKIDLINDLIPLVKVCKLETCNSENNGVNENLPKLSYLSAIVQEMEEMLNIVDTELDRQKGDLLNQKDLIMKKFDCIQDHCEHLASFKRNIKTAREIKETNTLPNPKVQSQSMIHQPVTKANVKSVRKEDNRIKKPSGNDTNKAKHPVATEYKSNKSRDIPIVEPISKYEFDDIPQYMRGRITHSSLNQGLVSFMETITAKYQLLATHSSRHSDEEMKRAQLYKSQENSETSGQLFCTTDDLKLYSNLKETNTTKIVLTCLRHCKRVKEIRGPGKLIRYALVKP
ncbi:spindle and kinetochore-associated protein 1 [Tetranychus urticae]|uniref:SKA complex subunit 1 n=1 Tax=Tetranychus urticae TaxID=32264 RepID=T1KU71_TETUR|nr:spindle and kinetochore-associated protein 1 [Tetranychus urticae]